MKSRSSDKPFGWGALAAAALGGFLFGKMGDDRASADQSSIQPLYQAAPQFENAQPDYSLPVYFANCSAARAAGAAPVRRGDPGYAPHLDRDRDGVGCE
ncbi:excalibur calcium-binding domain-containing protein [Erythrobacter sp. GH1-10]|uniref:excalibur calcium-binding domain-containing protein n=1 Tax=Erythrobacter sp. GH1-10 TaxID=3349334 RepID=UPI003877B30C